LQFGLYWSGCASNRTPPKLAPLHRPTTQDRPI
jgi:hypothetical protein